MKNLFSMIFGTLITQPEEASAQGEAPQTPFPQTPRPPGADAPSIQGLASLPAGQIREKDLPRIQTLIGEVLTRINESLKPAGAAGGRSDLSTVRSGILAFMGWLNRQGCVVKASTTYDLESTDKYSDNIFAVYPGQLPFDIVFNLGADVTKQHRLMIFVSRIDLLSFGSLVENKSLGGVPVPEPWPSAYLSKSS